MKIIINEVTYDDIGFSVYDNVGTLDIYTDKTLMQVLNEIGENKPIELYDEENELVSLWQNKGVLGATTDTINGRHRVTVRFDVSILNSYAEQRLNNAIDESVDGIMELAALIDAVDANVSEQNTTINALNQNISTISASIDTINAQLTMIPSDLAIQLSDIQALYNRLADRVAALENRE